MKQAEPAISQEASRTGPDYHALIPRSFDGSHNDSLNEHFLTFDGPDGSLMACWTQSGSRAMTLNTRGPTPQRNRVCFMRSEDEGITWSEGKRISGPRDMDDPTHMSSWQFPMVSSRGRIYIVWNQHQGVSGWQPMHTGTMSGSYSDDNGETWSEPQDVPMPRSPYDADDPSIPGEWIVWQRPIPDLQGRPFMGYTRWVHPDKARWKECPAWPWWESVIEFMRFTNIEDHPEPADLQIEFSAWGDEALRVPAYLDPYLSVAQEPALVRLPDDSLFCVFRTLTGMIWYSTSDDDGKTWSNPGPLLRRDHGRPLLQTVSCTPLYQLADGRYLLLHHDRCDNITGDPADAVGGRRPCYAVLAEFRPDAKQPLWFSDSKQLMDTEGFHVNGEPTDDVNAAVGVYPSFTTRSGRNILWYPDRKFFLLGKHITDDFLKDMVVPV